MENERIIQVIEDLFHGVDARDWQTVKSLMAQNVLLDYTSMTGGSPSLQTPKQITDTWAAFLPGFDKTNHQLSGFEVMANNLTANVHYNGKADHFINNEVWVVEGTYETELQKEGSQWVITRHQFNFEKQGGNTDLPGLASQRMKS